MAQFHSNFTILYRIISFNEDEQTIVVRYWTDFLSEEELASAVGVDDKGKPLRCRTDYTINIYDHIKTKADLENVLVQWAPVDWFKLQYKVKHPDFDHTIKGSMSPVKTLLNKTFKKKVVEGKIIRE